MATGGLHRRGLPPLQAPHWTHGVTGSVTRTRRLFPARPGLRRHRARLPTPRRPLSSPGGLAVHACPTHVPAMSVLLAAHESGPGAPEQTRPGPAVPGASHGVQRGAAGRGLPVAMRGCWRLFRSPGGGGGVTSSAPDRVGQSTCAGAVRRPCDLEAQTQCPPGAQLSARTELTRSGTATREVWRVTRGTRDRSTQWGGLRDTGPSARGQGGAGHLNSVSGTGPWAPRLGSPGTSPAAPSRPSGTRGLDLEPSISESLAHRQSSKPGPEFHIKKLQTRSHRPPRRPERHVTLLCFLTDELPALGVGGWGAASSGDLVTRVPVRGDLP